MDRNKLTAYKEYPISIGDTNFVFFTDFGTILEVKSSFQDFHSHEFYELFYILKGSAKIHTPDSLLTLKEGDCALVAPGTLHETELESDSHRLVISYIIKGKKGKSTGHFKQFQKLAKDNIFFCNNFVGGSAFKRFAQYYYSTYQDKDELLLACLHEIIVLLKSAAKTESESSSPQKLFDSSNYRSYIIAQFFTDNFREGTLTELAENLHISPQQTERLVKKLYNHTFREHIILRKLKFAARLLESTDMTSAEISAELGYSYPHSFLTAFKKQYNLTPYEYRKKVKKNATLQ